MEENGSERREREGERKSEYFIRFAHLLQVPPSPLPRRTTHYILNAYAFNLLRSATTPP